MTLVVVAGVSFVLMVGACVVFFGPALLLRLHHGTEVQPDQAPSAHAVLAELARVAGIECPRLFVLPAGQPNGLALSGRSFGAVAITDGVFDTLGSLELRGLLAILLASLCRPSARTATMVASLALVCAPLHPAHWRVSRREAAPTSDGSHEPGLIGSAASLPALAIVRLGLRGEGWFGVDSAAAELAGSDSVIAALVALEAHATDTNAFAPPATSSLFCVRPAGATGWTGRKSATQPTTESRVTRLIRAESVAPEAANERARETASGR